MTEHEPAEAARPTLGRRDAPDALRPDTEDEDRPHRTLPPEDADTRDTPDDVRPTESPVEDGS